MLGSRSTLLNTFHFSRVFVLPFALFFVSRSCDLGGGIRQQLVEMDRIQLSLKQLQEAHMLMKQQYEDEIMRLRHKLEHPHSQGPDGPGVGRLPVRLLGYRRFSPFSAANIVFFFFFGTSG